MDLLQESLVEVDDVLPVVDVGNNDSLLLGGFVSDDGVVDGDTLKVVVDSVCEGDESVGDVGTVAVKSVRRKTWAEKWKIAIHVETSVRFASQVNLPVVETKCIDKLLVETGEFKTELNLVGDVGHTLREANTDGLLDLWVVQSECA